jgi:hypothetical protein
VWERRDFPWVSSIPTFLCHPLACRFMVHCMIQWTEKLKRNSLCHSKKFLWYKSIDLGEELSLRLS